MSWFYEKVVPEVISTVPEVDLTLGEQHHSIPNNSFGISNNGEGVVRGIGEQQEKTWNVPEREILTECYHL